MPSLPATLQAGLASYIIERELGRGGMARVFLARDLKHDRLVALKVLDPELAASVGAERFLREIRVVARLQHPHILPIHDSGQIQGGEHSPALLWFTMPYVEGETLRDRLAREGQLPIPDAVRVAREVADALACAHAHGVIHRDIKPENLLLTGGHTMVTDFGVARAVGDEHEGLTETGLTVGTPAYMSPEQATGARAVDARSDVYALGCVLYEMLAGEPPYTGPTPLHIVARAMTEPYRALHTVRDTVPIALEQVVAKALARTPADRYQTATEMVADLSPDVVTPVTVPASPPPRVPALSLRSRWAWPVAAATFLALAILFLWRWRASSFPSASADVIAVAPFALVSADPELAVWSEGLVDVVSRYFDGAGTLRAIAPTRAIRAWTGRADREAATQFGHALSARYVVFGQLVGTDTVRLTATLLDLADSTVLDEHEWRGTSRRLDRLADSLATRFLDVLGRTRQAGLARASPLGTGNPLAVRAFLSGMRDLRRAAYREATDRFLEAVALDTGFVLARMYASAAVGWAQGVPDSARTRLALEAGSRNHGLGARDSLLLLADSIHVGIRQSQAPPFNLVARLWKVLDTLLIYRPDDPEVLYQVTEQNFHYNPLGKSERWHLTGFKRAIAMDPLFAPAYEHAIELSAMLDPPDSTRALIRGMLAVPGLDSVRMGALRLADRLLDPALPVAAKRRLLDSTPTGPILQRAHGLVQDTPDSIGIMFTRAFLARVPERRDNQLYFQLLYHGRLREAARALPDSGQLLLRLVITRELAALGLVPVASFDTLFDSVLAGRGRAPFLIGAPLWLAVRDTLRLRQLLDRVQARAAASPQSTREEQAVVIVALEATLKLARGDSSGFRGRDWREARSRLPPGWRAETPAGLFPADISLAVMPEDSSWALLQSRQSARPTPTSVIWMLYRARLAEKRGEYGIALDDYGFVARLWADADEPLRTFAEEARAGLARLSAEPKR